MQCTSSARCDAGIVRDIEIIFFSSMAYDSIEHERVYVSDTTSCLNIVSTLLVRYCVNHVSRILQNVNGCLSNSPKVV
uniref:Putative ovule protein n=1 Tax=Solanum chacoense TaxID=4108 RepID=A0A0V0H381_SOLCH